MRTTLSLAEIRERHPEFVYQGRTYRHSYASGDWLYLDKRNEWRTVPANWTHILRELPAVEEMERRLTDEQPPKVVIVGAGVGNGKLALRTRPAMGLVLDRYWFDDVPAPLGGKFPKRIDSKIAQRYVKSRVKANEYVGAKWQRSDLLIGSF